MDHNIQTADLLIHIYFARKGRKIYFYPKTNEKYFISHQLLEIMLKKKIFFNRSHQTTDLLPYY